MPEPPRKRRAEFAPLHRHPHRRATTTPYKRRPLPPPLAGEGWGGGPVEESPKAPPSQPSPAGGGRGNSRIAACFSARRQNRDKGRWRQPRPQQQRFHRRGPAGAGLLCGVATACLNRPRKRRAELAPLHRHPHRRATATPYTRRPPPPPLAGEGWGGGPVEKSPKAPPSQPSPACGGRGNSRIAGCFSACRQNKDKGRWRQQRPRQQRFHRRGPAGAGLLLCRDRCGLATTCLSRPANIERSLRRYTGPHIAAPRQPPTNADGPLLRLRGRAGVGAHRKICALLAWAHSCTPMPSVRHRSPKAPPIPAFPRVQGKGQQPTGVGVGRSTRPLSDDHRPRSTSVRRAGRSG